MKSLKRFTYTANFSFTSTKMFVKYSIDIATTYLEIFFNVCTGYTFIKKTVAAYCRILIQNVVQFFLHFLLRKLCLKSNLG